MPIATLKFTLPDEEGEFKTAQQGRDAKIVLWEIDQHCRALLKHGDPSEETARLAQEIRDMIPQPLLED